MGSKKMGYKDGQTMNEEPVLIVNGPQYDAAPDAGHAIVGFILKVECELKVAAKGEAQAQCTKTLKLYVKPYWVSPSPIMKPDKPDQPDQPAHLPDDDHSPDNNPHKVPVMHIDPPDYHPPVYHPGVSDNLLPPTLGFAGFVGGGLLSGAAAAGTVEACKDGAMAGGVVFGPVAAAVGGAVGLAAG